MNKACHHSLLDISNRFTYTSCHHLSLGKTKWLKLNDCRDINLYNDLKNL